MMKLIKRLFFFCVFCGAIALTINIYVIVSTQSKITAETDEVPDTYTVLVLGAKVYNGGTLSTYLKERIENAYALYEAGKVERFLLSGDHGTTGYDEVNAMKDYLVQKGVPQSDIFLDHAGFNTYNSVIRAKKVFEVDNLVIVSQDYHLPRAVFIAQYSGLEVFGFASSSTHLRADKRNKVREFLARIKSFVEIAVDILPQYLGEKIPITGDSQLSFD